MVQTFWDASALIKRYFPETGSDTVDAIFTAALCEQLSSPWGYAETFSLLVRRWNEQVLSRTAFETAILALQTEVVDAVEFGFLPIPDIMIFDSTAYTRKHSTNATDSAILAMLCAYNAQQPASSPCILVACDKRMLRAANQEGLYTINPQLMSKDDALNFINSLVSSP